MPRHGPLPLPVSAMKTDTSDPAKLQARIKELEAQVKELEKGRMSFEPGMLALSRMSTYDARMCALHAHTHTYNADRSARSMDPLAHHLFPRSPPVGSSRSTSTETASPPNCLVRRSQRKSAVDGVPHVGTTSTNAACMSLITTMVGSGVLGFPALFAKGGWCITGPLLFINGLAGHLSLLDMSWVLTVCDQRALKELASLKISLQSLLVHKPDGLPWALNPTPTHSNPTSNPTGSAQVFVRSLRGQVRGHGGSSVWQTRHLLRLLHGQLVPPLPLWRLPHPHWLEPGVCHQRLAAIPPLGESST